MSQIKLTLEQAVQIATQRILPTGYRPEDYFIVNNNLPFHLAYLIVKESFHLLKISRNHGS